MFLGDKMQKIEILKLDHNGRGIGKLNEKTIFVTTPMWLSISVAYILKFISSMVS